MDGEFAETDASPVVVFLPAKADSNDETNGDD